MGCHSHVRIVSTPDIFLFESFVLIAHLDTEMSLLSYSPKLPLYERLEFSVYAPRQRGFSVPNSNKPNHKRNFSNKTHPPRFRSLRLMV